MSELDANTVLDGQKVISIFSQSGEIVENTGVLDATCVVDTAYGKQKVVKTYLVGIGGGAELIKVVPSLPDVGVPGVFYGLFMDEETRDGYAIIQFFVWYNNQWCGAAAYPVDIDPENLLYKTDKNVANGVAGLNASAKLSSSVIPYATANDVGGIKQSFESATGTWTVVTDNI